MKGTNNKQQITDGWARKHPRINVMTSCWTQVFFCSFLESSETKADSQLPVLTLVPH